MKTILDLLLLIKLKSEELMFLAKFLEMHSKKFGFAEYIVKENSLMLNNKQITLKGINRHEHDPKNGRAITVDLIEKELKIIKQHNMNAIRCAHYPNNPAFYRNSCCNTPLLP